MFQIRKTMSGLRRLIRYFAMGLFALVLGSGVTVRGQDATGAGSLEAGQVVDMLQKVWRVQYRLSDLLTQVDTEAYKSEETDPGAFRRLYSETIDEMETLQRLRGDFEKSPENLFLAYDSRETIDRLLEALGGMEARMARRGETSLSGQLSEAGKELAGLQVPVRSYVTFLLGNYRQILSAMEGNLASCHERLSFAMGNQRGRERVVPNRLPVRSRSIPPPSAPGANSNPR
jgi:hypothetical protein